MITKAKIRVAIGGLLISLAVLLLGAVGGIGGFLFLSNTENETVQRFRNSIGLADNPAIPSVVTQRVELAESSVVIEAVKKISPSVVSITTAQEVSDYYGFIIGEQEGGGTGFIFTADGYIMTNKHVVTGVSEVTVLLPDGREFAGSVVTTDPTNDVAVVKIEAQNLPVVDLGDSDKLAIGQSVIAVGNVFGEFSNSVTLGVVSAMNRSLTANTGQVRSEQLTGLIQTDAAINPGNSGGPLVNLVGQVVGMNTAIASNTGSSAGVGFAIPVNAFRSAIESVIASGRIIRPGLGVRYIPITRALAEQNNLTVQYGALIARGSSSSEAAILSGSPAEAAGIKEGDIILNINDEKVTVDRTLAAIIGQYQVGDTVSILLLRDGAEKTVKATLKEL